MNNKSPEANSSSILKRPNINLNDVMRYVTTAAVIITESVFVVAIRGYYKKTMGAPDSNDRGIYDDAMVLVGPGYIRAFNANTDPSRYISGIGNVAPGLHYYKKGKHGISKPGKGYAAFRPATPDESLPGYRDGQKELTRIYNPNIHAGGAHSTNSAGCQTIHESQWLEFQQAAYRLMDITGQQVLPYLLVENT
jgi:lysozyme